MLNHEQWFLPGETITGTMPTELLGTPEDRDGILGRLRDDFNVAGAMESFEIADDSNVIRVVFTLHDADQAVERTSVAVIQRADGATVVTTDRALERITIVEGKMPMDLLVPEDKSKELPIVEKLRKDFAVRGELSLLKYEKESESFRADFKAPGYNAETTIQCSDGQTKVIHRTRGFVGVFLDLHRGKESGLPWSLVIDGVSILFVIVSITGLILWSSLRGRAQHGLAVFLLGLALSLAVYFVCVPR